MSMEPLDLKHADPGAHGSPQLEPTPYSDAASLYWSAGWRGILPLPPRQKADPPKGYTGRDGAWPSYPDVYAWQEERPTANICLRLPPDIIGVDVDAYGEKVGAQTLAELEARLGPLPPTWRVTSRDDGVSGIRLFRVPPGLRWPGVFGPAIENIRTEHRYAVVAPSIHPEGRTYRWIDLYGNNVVGVVPTPDDLPDLPAAWVEHFTKGVQATDQAHADMHSGQINDWITKRGAGIPCRHMQSALTHGMTDIRSGSSRHDAALAVTNRIIWLAGEGHPGGYEALHATYATFMSAVAGDRPDGSADVEWWRMLEGAVRMSAAAHPQPSTDPCLDPFREVKRQLKGIIMPEQIEAALALPTIPWNSPSGPVAWNDASKAKADHEAVLRRYPRLDLREVVAPDRPPREWVVEGLVPAGAAVSIHGPSGHGKSLVLLAMLVSVARGDPAFAGCLRIPKRRRVLLVDLENTEDDYSDRLTSFGLTPDNVDDLIDTLIIIDLPPLPPLDTAAGGNELLAILDAYGLTEDDVVVLDSTQRVIAGHENDSDTLREYYRHTGVELKRRGITVIRTDNTGKDAEKGARGTSGKRDDLDVELGLTKRGRVRDIRVTKMRGRSVQGVSVTVTEGDDGMTLFSATLMGGGDSGDTARSTFRPTALMEKVSVYLEQTEGRPSFRAIESDVAGKSEAKRKALAALEAEGYITIERGPSGHKHAFVKPYRQVEDPLSDRYQCPHGLSVSLCPECVPSVSGTHPSECVPVSPTLGGDTGHTSLTHKTAPVVRAAEDTTQRGVSRDDGVMEVYLGGVPRKVRRSTGEVLDDATSPTLAIGLDPTAGAPAEGEPTPNAVATEPQPTAAACALCGEALSDQRAAYGKALCVGCESTTPPATTTERTAS